MMIHPSLLVTFLLGGSLDWSSTAHVEGASPAIYDFDELLRAPSVSTRANQAAPFPFAGLAPHGMMDIASPHLSTD